MRYFFPKQFAVKEAISNLNSAQELQENLQLFYAEQDHNDQVFVWFNKYISKCIYYVSNIDLLAVHSN